MLRPGASLQWRRCADAPVGMGRAQVVAIEEKVYMGGGATISWCNQDDYRVLQYSKAEDKWSDLPRRNVRFFGMTQYNNALITVGGLDQQKSPTAKVLTLSADSQRWEEMIRPMPTARYNLCVLATARAIVVAGGMPGGVVFKPAATVEIYSADTSRWYTAEPLPAPHWSMPSVIIDDLCYLVGDSDCYMASLSSLIQIATSSTLPSATSSERESLWKALPPIPLEKSSVVCLKGTLLAVGGWSRDGASSAAYAFLNNEWTRLTNADLPVAGWLCGTAQSSSDEITVVRGWYDPPLKNTYIGTLLKD